jgi:regulatory protein
LRSKKIAEYSIDKGMNEIEEEEYLALLDSLIAKKLKGETDFETKQKVIASLQRKGFEFELIKKRMLNVEC